MSTRYTIALEKQLQYGGPFAWGRTDLDRQTQGLMRAISANGSTQFVSESVTGLLEDALGSWPDSPFNPDLAPSPYGFVYFEGLKRYKVDPIDGNALYGVGIGWAIRPISNDLITIALCIQQPDQRGVCKAWMLDAAIRKGETLSARASRRGLTEDDKDQQLRLIFSLWDFAQQRIAVRHSEQPERVIRRRLEREGWTHIPTIEVVELRARESAPHGRSSEPGPAPDWSCRWIVRRHWVNQACGPGRSQRKRMLVEAYVKGPPEKPLRTASKLFAVVR